MSFFSPSKLYAAEIAAVLMPGERLIAAESAQYFPGEEEVGEVSDWVTFDPLIGLTVSKWDRAAGRAIGGLSLRAPVGSPMTAMVRQDGDTLVLTNQRLMLMIVTSGSAKINYSLPISEVLGISWNPRFLQHGRVLLLGRDQAISRWVLGVFFPGAARRLVAGWETLHPRAS